MWFTLLYAPLVDLPSGANSRELVGLELGFCTAELGCMVLDEDSVWIILWVKEIEFCGSDRAS